MSLKRGREGWEKISQERGKDSTHSREKQSRRLPKFSIVNLEKRGLWLGYLPSGFEKGGL